MNSFIHNPIVMEDIDNIVKAESIDWNHFRGKKVAVTGATGLVGKLTVMAFVRANEIYNLGITVLAFVRNIDKAKAMYADRINGSNIEFIIQDIMEPVSDKIYADYLIHGASITASKQMVNNPVGTIMTAIEGTKNMMDFAARCEMKGVVYLSSMEAYGIVDASQSEVYEKDLGFIDPLNIRSSYSEGKRMTECLCASYASQYGVKVKIARLAQTFGAGIDKNENRVFAQFARSILREDDIVLHTKGEKANCYCYTSDAVTGLITLLINGEVGQAYNIANMDTFCSIKEMAEIFIRVGETHTSQLVFDIPKDISKFGYAPNSIMKLNSEKMMALGWKPLMNMADMAKRFIESIDYEEKKSE